MTKKWCGPFRVRFSFLCWSPLDLYQHTRLCRKRRTMSDFLKVEGDNITLHGKPILLKGAAIGGWSEFARRNVPVPFACSGGPRSCPAGF